MFRMTRLISMAYAALIVIAFVKVAQASCSDGSTPELKQRVAALKRTGDCALIPGVMAASDRAFAWGNSNCGGWHRTKSYAQVEKEMRRFCRIKPQMQIAASTSKPPVSITTQLTTDAPPQAGASKKTTSCNSDITGTDEASSARNAGDCKDANRALNAARQLRKQKQFSLLAPEEYKKAAAAAQRAGDTELMLKITREADQSDATVPDKPDLYKQGLVRSATAMSNAAQELMKNTITCGDMKDAEALYLRAAKDFLDADEIDQADAMTRKHDSLAQTVDSLETQGKCNVRRPPSKQSPVSTAGGQADNSAKCQEALEGLEKLDRPTSNMASVGEPADPDSIPPNYNVIVAKMKLTEGGCTIPNAKPYTLRECLAARIYMFQQGTPLNVIASITQHAGCSK